LEQLQLTDRGDAPERKSAVVLAPGNAFSLSQQARGFLRFNVAQSMDARMFAVIEQALRPAKVADR
jgi:hypothetical protein